MAPTDHRENAMTRQPLILVPGVLCTAELWRDQTDSLGDVADMHVTMEHTRHGSVAEIAAAILAAAPPSFALAGLSMGGMIAFEIVRQAPKRVTRLALLDTGAGADPVEVSAVRRARIRLVEEGRFHLVLGLQLSRFIPGGRLADKALVDRIASMCEAVGPDAYMRQEKVVMARPDSRPSLGAIRCPTLVLCGRDDMATPLAQSQAIAAAIPGARLEIVEDCGHLSTMERPEAVNAALRAWLAT
jgi:pimeloyl-ACP methyl ester carboxylesterase